MGIPVIPLAILMLSPMQDAGVRAAPEEEIVVMARKPHKELLTCIVDTRRDLLAALADARADARIEKAQHAQH